MDYGGVNWVAKAYYLSGAPGATETSLIDSNGYFYPKIPIQDITASTKTITTAETGTLFLLNRAAGIVFTMPAPAVGLYYDFIVNTSVTSNAYKWSTATQGTDFFLGTLVGEDIDGTVTSGAGFTGNGTTHDNISMNGTTTGGLVGTQFRLIGISTTLWTCQGMVSGSGTIATPFATS
jgi:hypothetical protein